MKTKRRILAVFLAAAMLLTMLPAVALAKDTTVTINGEELVSGEPFQCGEGAATFNSASKTLILSNATIERTASSSGDCALRIDGEAQIELVGENKITCSDTKKAIYAVGEKLTFCGSGKLIINAYGEGIQLDIWESTTPAKDGGIVIDGCTLDITSKDYAGIYTSALSPECFANVIIKNKANVTIKANAEDSDNWAHLAIYGDNDVRISDSIVKAESAGETNAIYSAKGKVSISGSDVEAKNLSDNAYPAIFGTAGVEISASKVEANSAGDAAIYSSANIEIKDNSIIEATGRYAAIRGYSGLNIANSEVVANSTEDVAIYADSQYLTIQDSIIKATTNNKDTIACGQAVENPLIINSLIENSGGAIRETITLENVVNFQENEGEVIGNVELSEDLLIPEGMTLNVLKNATLTIPENITLTNEGVIKNYGTIINNGSLYNVGTIRNSGTIEGKEIEGAGSVIKVSSGTVSQKTLTFDTNGGSEISAVTENYGKTIVLADYVPKRDGYEFLGWYKDKELTEKIEYAVLDYDMTVYAKWQKLEGTADYDTLIVLTINDKTAVVNGEAVTTDAAPLIVNGRTYTPARFVAESLGAWVVWSPSARTVTIMKDDINIVLAIDSNIAYVNGQKVQMDASAFIADGRTYTPARFVAEQLGAQVKWDEETRTVTITK